MKEQLELKEIVGYLPYGLWVEWVRPADNKIIQVPLTMSDYTFYMHQYKSKPILFPITSLTEFLREIYQEYNYSLLSIKEMPYATIVTYQLMGETFKDIVYSQGSFNCCPMYVFNKLLEKKLDVYNLIEKGLAIEVTEEFNPYK
jgi:hypothetical protein